MSDSEYVSIDKIELKRLQADSEELSKLRAHPAALAPAAVVMPERRREQYDYGDLPDGEKYETYGYNTALDEVARLNRRAIPEGLMERICDNNFFGNAAIDELRALLGKS